MKLKITMDLDNEAFHFTEDEVPRILRDLALHIEGYPEITLGDSGPLMDFNGNMVGEWKVTR